MRRLDPNHIIVDFDAELSGVRGLQRGSQNEGNNVIKSHLKHILEKRTANGNSCPRKTSSSLVNELKSARGRMARSCPHIQGALLHDACFPHNIPDKIT